MANVLDCLIYSSPPPRSLGQTLHTVAGPAQASSPRHRNTLRLPGGRTEIHTHSLHARSPERERGSGDRGKNVPSPRRTCTALAVQEDPSMYSGVAASRLGAPESRGLSPRPRAGEAGAISRSTSAPSTSSGTGPPIHLCGTPKVGNRFLCTDACTRARGVLRAHPSSHMEERKGGQAQ